MFLNKYLSMLVLFVSMVITQPEAFAQQTLNSINQNSAIPTINDDAGPYATKVVPDAPNRPVKTINEGNVVSVDSSGVIEIKTNLADSTSNNRNRIDEKSLSLGVSPVLLNDLIPASGDPKTKEEWWKFW